MTTEQLKRCPFCGVKLTTNSDGADLYVKRYGHFYSHEKNDCFLSEIEVAPSEYNGWNRRTGATHEQ